MGGTVAGVVTGNAPLVAGSVAFTGTMLSISTAAEVVRTASIAADALLFDDSPRKAWGVGVNSAINIGISKIPGIGARGLVNQTQGLRPTFRSAITGRFVSDRYGGTVTAVSNAASAAVSVDQDQP